MTVAESNSWPIWGNRPFPTLGHECASWIEQNLIHGPGDVRGAKVGRITDDYYRFLCRALKVHPIAICGQDNCNCEEMAGRFVHKINVLSRLKGYAKTEDIAWILHWKLSGNCLPGEWNPQTEEFEPVMANSPYIPIAATAEDQAEDTLWGCFVAIASEARALDHLKVTDRRVTNPINYGEAKIVTSASARNDGGKPTAIGLDEVHLFFGNELLQLGKTLERNLAKRNVGQPQMFIATTMFMVGQNSYAENLWDRSETDDVILYDHHQASDHWDTTDDAQLREAIKEAAGDAIGWLNIRQMVSSYRADPNEGERYWLNRYGGGGNAKLVNIQAFRNCDVAEPLKPYDACTVGIDGSMYSDASGIVLCRLSDLSLHYVWHYLPDGSEEDSMAMAMDMDKQMQDLMQQYLLTRVYCDPPYITEYIAKWGSIASKSRQIGLKPQVVQWWTNRHTQMANATRELVNAVNLEHQPHDHNPILMEHFANAYRKEVPSTIEVDGKLLPGYVPRKSAPRSNKKIDLTVCAIIARQAAIDSITAGEDKKVKRPASGMVSY